jgi:hypothetical protein
MKHWIAVTLVGLLFCAIGIAASSSDERYGWIMSNKHSMPANDYILIYIPWGHEPVFGNKRLDFDKEYPLCVTTRKRLDNYQYEIKPCIEKHQ